MGRGPPSFTRTDQTFPYTTRFRSPSGAEEGELWALVDQQQAGAGVSNGGIISYGNTSNTGRQLMRVTDGAVSRARMSVGNGAAMISAQDARSEEHTSELQSLMRISYAVFCLTKKKKTNQTNH